MKRIILSICLCLLYTGMQAQIGGDLQKELDDMLSGMQMDMDLFTEQIQNDFHQFVAEQDKAFQEMLEKNWQELQLFNGTSREGNKPPVAPTATPDDKRPTSPIQLDGTPIPPGTLPEAGPVRIPKGDTPSGLFTYTFTLYGTPVEIEFDRNSTISFTGAIQEKDIANYWAKLADTTYDPILNSLFAAQKKMGLNDWGFYRLASEFAGSAYRNDVTSARLLTWFLMNKGGYRARLGMAGNEVILLLPFQQGVYEIPYIEKDGMRYFAMQPVKGNLKTYSGEFAEGNRPLDLQLATSPSFTGTAIKERPVAFTFNRKSYNFPLRYNQGLIDFFNDYPLTDIGVYFDASLSWELKEDLYTHFMPILTELEKKEDQVQLLLDFIYQSLPYMTDDEQFGGERYFFAEETIAYPYSDCEDRAVLFSHMVEALLNCPTIGIFYPNHVSAAVHLEGYKGEGYRYKYEGREYLSCDPTYINSLVGMAMSNFEGVSAQIIPVQAQFRKQTEEDILWEQLFAQGRFPASSKGHILPAPDGKYYVCGYDTQSGPTQPFIGKTNANGTFDWMHIIQTPNDLYRPALFAANGNVYITGQATSSVNIGNKQTAAADKLLFLAALSPTGDVKWLQGYETKDTPQTRAYMYTIATDGSIQNELWFPETGEMEAVALVDNGNTLTLSGILSGEGIATASANVTHSVASAAVPDMLHTINNKLVADNTNTSIAGIFAFIEMLNTPGQVVEGKDVVAALDKYNPSFKQRCPNIYKNIAAISLVVNESGVITVKTNNGKPVSFDKVRIQSGSKVNLRHLPSKDIKLEIIDGVKVGAAIVWFKLNHIVLYRKNGDLLFDYDKNHTTKTFNLAKDILN